jgi:hypothetical protein
MRWSKMFNETIVSCVDKPLSIASFLILLDSLEDIIHTYPMFGEVVMDGTILMEGNPHAVHHPLYKELSLVAHAVGGKDLDEPGLKLCAPQLYLLGHVVM